MPPYGSATGVPPTSLNLSPTLYPLPPVSVDLLESIAPFVVLGLPPEPLNVPVAVPSALYKVYDAVGATGDTIVLELESPS